MHEIDEHKANRYLQWQRRAWIVQDRLIATGLASVATADDPEKYIIKEPKTKEARNVAALVQSSLHTWDVQPESKTWKCTACRVSVQQAELGRWLEENQHCPGLPFKSIEPYKDGVYRPEPMFASCIGNKGQVELHSSHRLAIRRNIIFCWRCGAYSDKKVVNLKRECREAPSAKGKKILRAIKSNIHPKGKRKWAKEPGFTADGVSSEGDTKHDWEAYAEQQNAAKYGSTE